MKMRWLLLSSLGYLSLYPTAGFAEESVARNVQDDPPQVEALGQKLRCPVCQGMPIGDSPAPMAQDMMRRVRDMTQQGHSAAAIEDYFVERYGSWVLLEPPTQGVAFWVWALPPLLLVVLVMICLRGWLPSRRAALPVKNGLGVAAGAADEPSEPAGESEEDIVASIYREIRR